MRRFRILLLSFLFSLCSTGLAGEAGFELSYPILDLPYNVDSDPAWPSMQQSLHLTKSFYQAVHRGIQDRFVDHPAGLIWATIGFDVLATWLPFGDAWAHEEWHRAVMANRGIDSYNEVYDFKIFSELIAVSQVADDDLVRLKDEHPQDLIRLHAAGLEAQNELNFAIEQDMFFLNTRTFDAAVLWLNYANNWGYLDTCASKEADTTTQDILKDEGTDISQRDFTGLDCDAWVYDLFRPTEPYSARGIHPSGVGIDRYIQWSDLTEEEQDYLSRQKRLSLLNFVNPFLFGKRDFQGRNPWNNQLLVWNGTLRHHLTTFGYNLDANVFLRSGSTDLLLIWHQYFNRGDSFPGFEVRLLRYPWHVGNKLLPVTARLALWQQPKDGAFRTNTAETGGLAAVKLAYPLAPQWQGYVEVEGKSAGWVAGNVYLNDNLSLRLGAALLLK